MVWKSEGQRISLLIKKYGLGQKEFFVVLVFFVYALKNKRISLWQNLPLRSLFLFGPFIQSFWLLFRFSRQTTINFPPQFYYFQTQRQPMKVDSYETNQSAENLRQYEYVRSMGSFRPRFTGIPQEFYPLTCCETFMYVIIVVLTIGGVLGIMIGFLYWITNNGLVNFTIVWSIIFLMFVLLMIIAFYFGSKGRIREEKRMIAEQQVKQQAMANKDNKRNQKERNEQM